MGIQVYSHPGVDRLWSSAEPYPIFFLLQDGGSRSQCWISVKLTDAQRYDREGPCPDLKSQTRSNVVLCYIIMSLMSYINIVHVCNILRYIIFCYFI